MSVDYIGRRALIPVLTEHGIETRQLVTGHDRRRILNEMGDELAAVFPSTRAVDQPWFGRWLPPAMTLALADAILKETWRGPILHAISEDASPFWCAMPARPAPQPRPWQRAWWSEQRWRDLQPLRRWFA